MKDQRARERLSRLEGQFDEQVNCGLRDIVVEHCPECKHDTLQLKHFEISSGYFCARPKLSHRQCLVCSGKWVEESKTKTVAYKEPK